MVQLIDRQRSISLGPIFLAVSLVALPLVVYFVARTFLSGTVDRFGCNSPAFELIWTILRAAAIGSWVLLLIQYLLDLAFPDRNESDPRLTNIDFQNPFRWLFRPDVQMRVERTIITRYWRQLAGVRLMLMGVVIALIVFFEVLNLMVC